jgi:hypothetical protein
VLDDGIPLVNCGRYAAMRDAPDIAGLRVTLAPQE